MVKQVFKDYARLYDIIYSEKDYAAECEFLRKIFSRYAQGKVSRVLDLACGTGRHAIDLAKTGFQVYAQDVSAQMLLQARVRAKISKAGVRFLGPHPMQDFSHRIKFDAVLAMFSSIDYITKTGELKQALNNVRKVLRPGGVFTFDFWNRECVKKEYSPLKIGIFEKDHKKVLRISETSLDNSRDVADIRYTCYYFEGGRRKAMVEERHLMKYHDIRAMRRLVESCGFSVLDCFPFMHINASIKPSDWNISLVATPKSR